MINLDDIKGRSAVSILEKYTGINPYIKKMQIELKKNGKIKLTEGQTKYIVDNHETEPILVNRVVSISKFLGDELQKQENLSFTPERILVEYILADNDKVFHVYGKLKKNQEVSKMYFLPKTQVLDDPYYEEIKIDVNFDKYSKDGSQLYEHQKEGIKFLLTRNGCILADDMGLGKMEFVDNQLYTPYGRKRIGDTVVGDKIIGSDGLPYNVTGVYPQGTKELYKVSFNDGYSILVGGEHLWSVSSSNSGENSKNRVNRYLTLSTNQMLDKNLIIEQKGYGWNEKRPYKFSTYYKNKNGGSKWQIPIVKPIEFSNKFNLPIEPYLLGVILGDGHNKKKSVNFTFHIDDFDEILYGVKFNEIKSSRPTIRICNLYLENELIDLGLDNKKSYEKFIPNMYKYSSISDRLAILQGLMDTDGHVIKNKSKNKITFQGTEFATTSEQLADDVVELVQSLGGVVRKKSKVGSYTKDGVKHLCRICYRLNIKMPKEFNPFRLKRKSIAYNTPEKYKVGRYIKNIELCGSGEAICISVDSPDKLYVTEHAIVTHNTRQSIIAALESGAKNILIVCPSSVKINWKREIEVFCDDVTIVSGRKWDRAKFTIINYDILKNFHTLGDGKKNDDFDPVIEYNRHLVNSNFDLIIADEAHALKNNKSIRGEIMYELSVKYGVERVWLLTGTPVANRPMDFYNLLRLIKSPIVDNWQYFVTRYCDARKMFRTLKNGKKKQIWITDGASNLEELSQKTKNLIIRRLKTEVLDMPEKIISPMYYELTDNEWEEYDKLWDDYLEKRNVENKTGSIQRDLVELILLRKFIAITAIQKTIELAETALENGEKVIIFTSFTDELNELAEYFGKLCVTHNGPMSDREKQKSVDSFQTNPKKKVFIGNIKSAGVGITLTQATVVIFNSFDWVPGVNEQAEDRAYRIGQKNCVNVYYQLFEKTISTRMWDVLRNKKDIISTIMGDTKLTDNEVLELLMDKFLLENG